MHLNILRWPLLNPKGRILLFITLPKNDSNIISLLHLSIKYLKKKLCGKIFNISSNIILTKHTNPCIEFGSNATSRLVWFERPCLFYFKRVYNCALQQVSYFRSTSVVKKMRKFSSINRFFWPACMYVNLKFNNLQIYYIILFFYIKQLNRKMYYSW